MGFQEGYHFSSLTSRRIPLDDFSYAKILQSCKICFTLKKITINFSNKIFTFIFLNSTLSNNVPNTGSGKNLDLTSGEESAKPCLSSKLDTKMMIKVLVTLPVPRANIN